MVLRGLIGMCFRMRRMPFRGVRMMGRRFVIALFVMLGRLVMMLRRLFVMMCGLLVVFRTLMICHCRLLVLR